MKRWAAHGFIATYLGALAFGMVCHTMNFAVGAHPAMYFIVWDMYSGWSVHENRLHLLAEGVSGNYYSLAPSPWATIRPYGELARHQYDVHTNSSGRIAENVLAHTEHEPITRVIVVEENWPKKYNLPDELWAQRFEYPREPVSYFWTRATLSPTGETIARSSTWVEHLNDMTVSDNPRLRQDARRGRPFLAIDPSLREKSLAFNDAPYAD